MIGGHESEKLALLLRDAERGVSRAQRHLANRYLRGRGIEQDEGLAAYWMRRAAEQGLATAERDLGVLLEHGVGLERDLNAARYWYSRAAAQADRLATEHLRRLSRQDV